LDEMGRVRRHAAHQPSLENRYDHKSGIGDLIFAALLSVEGAQIDRPRRWYVGGRQATCDERNNRQQQWGNRGLDVQGEAFAIDPGLQPECDLQVEYYCGPKRVRE